MDTTRYYRDTKVWNYIDMNR